MKKAVIIIRNLIFCCLVLIMLVSVFLYTFIWKEQNPVSLFENRNLAVKQQLNDTAFIDSSFQNTLEDVLADQFYERQKIVEIKKKFDRNVDILVYGQDTEQSKLTRVGDTSVYQVGSSSYLINQPMDYDPDIEKRILNRIEQMNQIAADYPEIDFYLYRPIQAHETDLFDEINGIESYGSYYNELFKENSEIPIAFLEIKDLDAYKDMFYCSDHHWNYKGSYQGYADVMTLMSMESEILEPSQINTNKDIPFYGTFSSRTAHVFEPDSYYLYEIDYAPVKVLVDGNEVEDIYSPKHFMDHVDDFISDPYLYHYEFSYPVYAEAEYFVLETSQEEKENILVIGDSYMRAIAHYLASSFHASYFVNPTYYISNTGRYFNYDQFLAEHDIDKVLFMYTIENYFAVDQEWGDIYKNFDVHRLVEE